MQTWQKYLVLVRRHGAKNRPNRAEPKENHTQGPSKSADSINASWMDELAQQGDPNTCGSVWVGLEQNTKRLDFLDAKVASTVGCIGAT